MSHPSVSPAELKRSLDNQPSNWFLVDVRSPGEYRSGHLTGAANTPVDEFTVEAARTLSSQAGDRRVCLICQSGKRSQKALDVWHEAGLSNAVELAGGMNDWPNQSTGSLESNGGAISLFRQVQIVAGSFVFIGTLLGVFVDRWFLLIPGFFGAGLTFAGISGTCGMGMLLSKMPWNR